LSDVTINPERPTSLPEPKVVIFILIIICLYRQVLSLSFSC
jgi:hypothetical protein